MISICYLQPSNVEAEEDYRQKIVLNHTDQTFPLEDLDVNYLTQIEPNIVVELKEKYTETETYYKDLLKRESVKRLGDRCVFGKLKPFSEGVLLQAGYNASVNNGM